ncbi:MAG: DUF5685 family protein [Clostridia bacterium]
MFGYIVPDKPNLLIKDFALYRAHYCGLCKTLGLEAGQIYRFATNYDSTFLSLLLHNLLVYTPIIEDKGCILNEFKKKPIVARNEILVAVADVTLMLFYYKADDDVLDENKHRAIKLALSGKYKKLKIKYPKLDKMMSRAFKQLNQLEVSGSKNIDALADCSANILATIIDEIGEHNEAAAKLGYYLGRWIYFMDALDDCENDFKKKRFNPLLQVYGEFTNRNDFINNNLENLKYVLYSSYNLIVEYYDKINVTIGEGVLSNIIYVGLPAQMERILKGETKCQKIRI